jgi:hypothetical protein
MRQFFSRQGVIKPLVLGMGVLPSYTPRLAACEVRQGATHPLITAEPD